MSILCKKCGSDMIPNKLKDFIECPKCGYWTREWVLIYELVLKLEQSNQAH